jgi:hypothetical protein
MSMDWKDIAGIVGKSAPILGTLLGGPAGGAVGALVASALGVGSVPDAVSQALATNPDAAVKLQQIEATRQVELQTLLVQAEASRLSAETAAVQAVNTTIQAEAKADHWPTYAWRPFIGFCVGFNTIAASLLVLGVYGGVMFGAQQAAAALPSLPLVLGALAAISGTVLPILGIASYFRGKMQADPNVATDGRG